MFAESKQRQKRPNASLFPQENYNECSAKRYCKGKSLLQEEERAFTRKNSNTIEEDINVKSCTQDRSFPRSTSAAVVERVVRSMIKGFICPLTLEIMFDPVLDAEGNTYERTAVTKWIQQHRTSPISRQPLSESMLISNNALREAIHEFCGEEWVKEKQKIHDVNSSKDNELMSQRMAQHHERYPAPRAKINCFLQFVAEHLGGSISLALNEKGCCAFRIDDMVIVIDVPEKGELFSIYTRNIAVAMTESMKDILLEMNYLQGETRGGCLSVKKQENVESKNGMELSEVMFSYTDRVAEISANDFLNIVTNFIETACSVRRKLRNCLIAKKEGNTGFSERLESRYQE